MMQQRSCVLIENKQYCDRNISYISIDVKYFNLHILLVGIARLTYMVIKHMSIEIIYHERLLFLADNVVC